MTTMVTGAAGFIGYHMAKRLLEKGQTVLGIDNLDPYYSVVLKQDRVKQLLQYPNFHWHQLDICDEDNLQQLFVSNTIETVVHLAAQAGVRDSIQNPKHYLQSNYIGFFHLMEAIRRYPVRHFLFASSSSVYGGSQAIPFSENANTDHPLSLYAASKKANELMAHSYAHLYGIPATGLRFFSVYGPWGRPDMALFLFVQSIARGEPITLFNAGEMSRDFTYVEDVVSSMIHLIDTPPIPDNHWTPHAPYSATSGIAPYQVLNVGGGNPVSLLRLVTAIEKALGKKAIIQHAPMQPGDSACSHCDAARLLHTAHYVPRVSIEEGVRAFVAWYQSYCS